MNQKKTIEEIQLEEYRYKIRKELLRLAIMAKDIGLYPEAHIALSAFFQVTPLDKLSFLLEQDEEDPSKDLLVINLTRGNGTVIPLRLINQDFLQKIYNKKEEIKKIYRLDHKRNVKEPSQSLRDKARAEIFNFIKNKQITVNVSDYFAAISFDDRKPYWEETKAYFNRIQQNMTEKVIILLEDE